MTQPTHDTFVRHLSHDELKWNMKFIHLFTILAGTAPYEEVLRGMLVAATACAVLSHQSHGRPGVSMPEDEQLKLIQFFSDALLSANLDTDLTQILPH